MARIAGRAAIESTSDWRPWFAWPPVRYAGDRWWLTTVLRRRWLLVSDDGRVLGAGHDYMALRQ